MKAGQGYRTVPHTADLRIEAWAGSRCDCIAAALRGLISTFADTRGARPARVVWRRLEADSSADLLAAAADELIYLLDTGGELPVSIQLQAGAQPGRPGRAAILMGLELASIESVQFIGAIPKAVSLHELVCQPDAGGCWLAAMTVDV
jgi:SHS2 domain-containing protein